MSTKVNLVMDQGATFNTTFTVLDTNDSPIDFTDYTASSQMRKSYTALIAYPFNASAFANGQITLSMNAATTSTISAGRYVYDLEITDESGTTSRIAEGLITVTPQVTR
jgi:hypothetical protein